MPFRPKHPGLQAKFEQLLRNLLGGGAAMGTRDIIAAAKESASRLGITDEELADIEINFANYSGRARQSDLIVSGGPWGGYRLTNEALAAQVAQSAQNAASPGPVTPSVSTPGEAPAQQASRKHWESLLHLPLTVALSSRFSSRVVSLPNAPDSVRWGNPDMLMVRPSPLTGVEELNAGLDAEVFRLVDVTPECILASIEVKSGLERDRSKLFTAVAEAAANSRWANEAWLVFVDRNQAGQQPLDEDVISLARSVEVGLLEVRFVGAEATLAAMVHLAAPTRATLRVNELKSERANVLLAAQKLLKQWRSAQPTFLDVDTAEQKARVLFEQAIANLRTQKGFPDTASIRELLAPFRAEPSDADFTRRLLTASLRGAARAGDVLSDDDLVQVVGRAADEALVRREAEVVKEALAAIGETRLPTETAGATQLGAPKRAEARRSP